MKQFISIILLLLIVACQPSTNPISVPVTQIDSVKPAINSYLFFGTTSTYTSADDAYAHRNFGRPYYRDIPIVAVGMKLYQTSNTNATVQSNNQWVCITSQQSNGVLWYSVQLDNSGNIIAYKSY